MSSLKNCSGCGNPLSKIGAPNKSGLCKACYQKKYWEEKNYYQNNEERIKKRAKQYRLENLDRYLKQAKNNREKRNFDSKRMQAIIDFDYTCYVCKNNFDDSDLVVHHEDRTGRTIKEGKHNNYSSNLKVQCRACHVNEYRDELNKARAKKMKLLPGQWNRKYKHCVECGTTERKYGAHGLCINCYARFLNKKKEDEDIV